MDGGILEVSWLKNIWEKFWSVYLIFTPATLEEVKIGRIHDFILSCRGLYCFNNLNKISLPKYDRAIVIVKKKKDSESTITQ